MYLFQKSVKTTSQFLEGAREKQGEKHAKVFLKCRVKKP